MAGAPRPPRPTTARARVPPPPWQPRVPGADSIPAATKLRNAARSVDPSAQPSGERRRHVYDAHALSGFTVSTVAPCGPSCQLDEMMSNARNQAHPVTDKATTVSPPAAPPRCYVITTTATDVDRRVPRSEIAMWPRGACVLCDRPRPRQPRRAPSALAILILDFASSHFTNP